MDALEFLKEERRMCNSFDIGCVKCPLGDIGCCVSPEETDEEFEKEIVIVEQWSKEHPRKTRQSVFLEQYPETRIGDDGSKHPDLMASAIPNANVVKWFKTPACKAV